MTVYTRAFHIQFLVVMENAYLIKKIKTVILEERYGKHLAI